MRRGFLNNKNSKKAGIFSRERNEGSLPSPPVVEMKLSYGKVEDNDIPADYKPGPLDLKTIPPGFEDSSPDIIIMTTMPPVKAPGDLHNQTEWITRPSTKRKVLNIPGFPHPVPEPAQLSYVIKETEKMGMGVFATRDIEFGELIFAERPLLVVPANCAIAGVAPPAHYTLEQQKRIIMMEWEKKLEVAVEQRMEEQERKAFKELHNSHTEDGSGPILGVVRTNGFAVLGEEHTDKDDYAVTRGYSAVGKIGSRINHSCVSNVRCTFSKPSFSLRFTAVRDIRKGDQLFYSYTSQTASAQDRQKSLAPYGIVCECDACVDATPESDLLRQGVAQRIKHFYQLCDSEWMEVPGSLLSVRVLDPVFELKKAIEDEGLETELDFMPLLVIFHKVYMRMGLVKKAEKYKAELGRLITLPCAD